MEHSKLLYANDENKQGGRKTYGDDPHKEKGNQRAKKETRIWQPGNLVETHGFPSLPRNRFGVVLECLRYR
jgi:hypothetical protein